MIPSLSGNGNHQWTVSDNVATANVVHVNADNTQACKLVAVRVAGVVSRLCFKISRATSEQ
eukprot:3202199-Karenia_brevis.AAC.1